MTICIGMNIYSGMSICTGMNICAGMSICSGMTICSGMITCMVPHGKHYAKANAQCLPAHPDYAFITPYLQTEEDNAMLDLIELTLQEQSEFGVQCFSFRSVKTYLQAYYFLNNKIKS